MVADAGLRDQRDKVGRSRDDDKSPAVVFDAEDVKRQQDDGQQQLDAFVDQQPGELVRAFFHVFLHQMAKEGAQYHIEVGGGDHPVVPP